MATLHIGPVKYLLFNHYILQKRQGLCRSWEGAVHVSPNDSLLFQSSRHLVSLADMTFAVSYARDHFEAQSSRGQIGITENLIGFQSMRENV